MQIKIRISARHLSGGLGGVFARGSADRPNTAEFGLLKKGPIVRSKAFFFCNFCPFFFKIVGISTTLHNDIRLSQISNHFLIEFFFLKNARTPNGPEYDACSGFSETQHTRIRHLAGGLLNG